MNELIPWFLNEDGLGKSVESKWWEGSFRSEYFSRKKNYRGCAKLSTIQVLSSLLYQRECSGPFLIAWLIWLVFLNYRKNKTDLNFRDELTR